MLERKQQKEIVLIIVIQFQVQRLKVITAPPLIDRFSGNSKSENETSLSASSSGSVKKSPEFFVFRGNNLTVNCDVLRGIPFPQISWKKNLVTFFDFDHSLNNSKDFTQIIWNRA